MSSALSRPKQVEASLLIRLLLAMADTANAPTTAAVLTPAAARATHIRTQSHVRTIRIILFWQYHGNLRYLNKVATAPATRHLPTLANVPAVTAVRPIPTVAAVPVVAMIAVL